MGSRDTFVLRRKRKESRRQGLEQNRRQKQQSKRNMKARKRTESETLFCCQEWLLLVSPPGDREYTEAAVRCSGEREGHYYLTS